jgi:tRNA-Thr(GGU) m(6)t(6)A37 methyltransferase TsaA
VIPVEPIGVVHSLRTTVEDDEWGSVESVIELNERFEPESLLGIEDFSHAEIIFVFDRVSNDKIETAARHPRNNPQWPRVGIFAQRGKNRPNRLGLMVVEVVARDGRSLNVRGLDAVDGSPVLDIKPVMVEFLPRGQVRQPEWATELMRNYWHRAS